MQLSDIIDCIEQIAPPAAQASWDASGIQVASRQETVNKLAVCLDPSPASVGQALQQGAQCILSHHPLALKPTLPRVLDNYHEVLRLLLCNGASLYAAHTSLDVNAEGPAGWLAAELGLQGLAVLEPVPGAPASETLPLGYGLVGDLPQKIAFPALLERLSPWVNLHLTHLSGPLPQTVGRIAYCTGSGSSLLAAARLAGADIFITGDVKYHTALDSDIALLDVGHHSLEEEMMRRMAALLHSRLPELEVVFVASASPMRPVILP